MLRKLILLDEATMEEFIFPVTPPGYRLDREMVMQTVELFGVGDYPMPAHPRLLPIKLEDMLLPVQPYPFCTAYRHADVCLAWLRDRLEGKKRVRFIVSGTAINELVYIQDIQGGEYDGTNDWTGSVTLQPVPVLAPITYELRETPAPAARAPAPQPSTARTYTVKTGDTLWGIARQFYGDGGLCYKLAAYNGIKNANIIRTGQVLQIPDGAALGKTVPVAATGISKEPGPTVTTSSASKPTPKPAPTPKQTNQTMTITATGPAAYHGWVTFSLEDLGTKRRDFGDIYKYPHKITASTGTMVNLAWKSKDGHKTGRAILDGKRLTNRGASSICVVLDVGHSLDVEWEK